MAKNNVLFVPISETRTEYVDRNVDITINRAPTDESVKLLREMEDKAKAQVPQSIAVEENGFNCVVQAEHHMLSDALMYRAVFDLNGKRMKAEATLSRHKMTGPNDHSGLLISLRDEVAKVIATEILSSGFAAMRTTKFAGV